MSDIEGSGEYPKIFGAEDAGLGFFNNGDYSFARRQLSIPLGLHELQRMVAIAPIGLAKRKDGWRLLAGTSVQGTDNLLLGPKGGWLAAHIPERLALFPLTLMHDEASGEVRLGAVSDSQRLVRGGDKLLVDEEGSPTELYSGYAKALARHMRSDQKLGEIGDMLLANDCLQELPRQAEGENAPVTYGPNIQALQALEGDVAVEMLANGCMALAYALHYSTGNARKFVQMKKRKGGTQPDEQADSVQDSENWLVQDQSTGFNFDV